MVLIRWLLFGWEILLLVKFSCFQLLWQLVRLKYILSVWCFILWVFVELVVSIILCLGVRNVDGLISLWVCVVCLGVVRYGCVLVLWCVDRFRIWGFSVVIIWWLVGILQLLSWFRYFISVLQGLWYLLIILVCLILIFSRKWFGQVVLMWWNDLVICWVGVDQILIMLVVIYNVVVVCRIGFIQDSVVGGEFFIQIVLQFSVLIFVVCWGVMLCLNDLNWLRLGFELGLLVV